MVEIKLLVRNFTGYRWHTSIRRVTGPASGILLMEQMSIDGVRILRKDKFFGLRCDGANLEILVCSDI